MKYMDADQYIYKRVALIGAIANPNTGDDAILDVHLNNLDRMYGSNYKVFVFSKDASYTVQFTRDKKGEVVPVDYLHRLTVESKYDYEKMLAEEEKLLSGKTFDDNLTYATLQSIFQEIDILHIIGGGYLNSLWPDMLMEVHIAAMLAKKYGKKILITGISTEPMSSTIMPYLLQILEIADVIDYRDDSFVHTGISEGGKLQKTLDDAVFFKQNRRSCYNTSHSYANIAMNVWEDNMEEIQEKIKNVLQPFMVNWLEEGKVEYFNILGFGGGDLHCWDEVTFPENLREKIEFISLINKPPFFAKQLVGNAVLNIGTRYHMAVFSLGSHVPILSIYKEGYYQNKICAAHAPYGSQSFCSIEAFNSEILSDFCDRCDEISKQLRSKTEEITELYDRKRWFIATAYGRDDAEKAILFNRLKEQNNIKVSVIIPVYNMERYLQKCLDSVISQTLKEIEIICVNDGSSDQSQEILFENAWKDERIHVFCQNNSGVSAARNAGLRQATGEYVFFLDPDDWLFDNNVLGMLFYAAKEHKVNVTGGGFIECNENLTLPVTKWSGNLCRYSFDKDGLYSYKDLQFDYGWIRFLYNRDFLLFHELWFPNRQFYEDPVWFVKVMDLAQQFYGISKTVYCYRTGYKSYDLTEKKVTDLLIGIGDIIEFAGRKGYYELLDLEKARLTKDYAGQITRCLNQRINPDIKVALERVNNLVYTEGKGRVEYEMFQWVLQSTVSEKEKALSESQNRMSEILHSLTWRIGDFILYIPKMIARAVRHEGR